MRILLVMLASTSIITQSYHHLLPSSPSKSSSTWRRIQMKTQQQQQQSSRRTTSPSRSMITSRRQEVLSKYIPLVAFTGGVTFFGPLSSQKAAAAAPSAKSASSYYDQIVAGYKELVALEGPEWVDTKAKGGDEVRRRLGIVGVKSPLFKIAKALAAVREAILENESAFEGVDLLDYVDATARIEDGIKSADFLAYSSIFSSYGNGGGGEDYLEESKKAMKPILVAYKEVLNMLKLSP